MINELLKTESSWEKIASSNKPVVIYGTGNGADAVFDRFEELGIKVSAVVASEGFVRSREFRGFKVKSIGDAEEEFGDFLLCIAFATSPFSPDCLSFFGFACALRYVDTRRTAKR